MKILNQSSEMVDVGSLKAHPDNPRQGDVGAIHQSIEANGFYGAIIAQRSTGHILAGNHRWVAAKHANADQVPVIWVDVDDHAAKRILLADNRTNDLASYDDAALADLLKGLFEDTGHLSGTGYDGDDLDDLLSDLGEKEISEDEAPEPPEVAETEKGDIWILGNHRLLCGDATSRQDVSRLMKDDLADLLLTDPPYNVDYQGPGSKLKIENDSMGDAAFRRFLVDAFAASFGALRAGGAFYVWHSDTEAINFHGAVRECGQKVRQGLVWVKSQTVIGRQDYQWQHEACLYGWKAGAAHSWHGDRTQPTVFDDAKPADLRKMKKQELVELAEDLQARLSNTETTVLREKKPSSSAVHPTMKPVKLIARQMRNSSGHGEIVLDPFLGSGTTLIAAEQIGRKCYGLELSPNFCDVIVERWENLTGKKATRHTRNT